MDLFKKLFNSNTDKTNQPKKSDDRKYSKEISKTSDYWANYAVEVKQQREKLLSSK